MNRPILITLAAVAVAVVVGAVRYIASRAAPADGLPRTIGGTLDEIAPDGRRRVHWANASTGRVFEMGIRELVVINCMALLGINPATATDEDIGRVTEISGQVAMLLAAAGWFTVDEWRDAVANDLLEGFESEIRDLETGVLTLQPEAGPDEPPKEEA